jgi:hypothetical protein
LNICNLFPIDREAAGDSDESDTEKDQAKPRRLKKYKEVLVDRIEVKRVRREERLARQIMKEKQSLLRKHEVADPYFDGQAELGSDNEENDNDVKNINEKYSYKIFCLKKKVTRMRMKMALTSI